MRMGMSTTKTAASLMVRQEEEGLPLLHLGHSCCTLLRLNLTSGLSANGSAWLPRNVHVYLYRPALYHIQPKLDRIF